MRVTFIANGCAVFEAENFRIVTDPWLTDGAFEGSWCHYPPLQTSAPELAKKVDAIYLSHIHPDHFDPASLKAFDRDLPVLVGKFPGDFLRKAVVAQGFRQVRECRDDEVVDIGPFKARLFGPLVKHHMHASDVGNLIDGALLLEHGGLRAFNLNDDLPTADVAARLKEQYGPFDLVMLQFCAAGPFPSCFQNLPPVERRQACDRTIERYLSYFTSIGTAMKPRYLMPFAGDFVLGGNQWAKNEFLGTTTVDHAFEYASPQLPGVTVVRLNEGMTLDVASGEIAGGPYQPLDLAEKDRYIAQALKGRVYPHEAEPVEERQLESFFREAMPLARENLWRWQARMKGFPPCHIYLKVPSGFFHFDFAKEDVEWVDAAQPRLEPRLECSMDFRLMSRILRRQAHWNNAEGGCHIDFFRQPDNYLPDVHTLLSFFHVPVTKPPEPVKEAS